MQWRQDAGYHRRSLAEHAMYRQEQLFGEAVASRLFESQMNEIHARIAAMNQMTDLEMPIAVRVGEAVS
ncbi:hypothetical protein G3480_20275 [Thiorhodococcus mannitoliphagus]|uniref:Uncharacterized protein n=1 Tax=Thiorhodococcus mannitoliphagus TaxID=329406 RepID=A0A6P1E003_9GAMM|nr:hypothetical protein [Thiorhodococcus mannitoliphagus]